MSKIIFIREINDLRVMFRGPVGSELCSELILISEWFAITEATSGNLQLSEAGCEFGQQDLMLSSTASKAPDRVSVSALSYLLPGFLFLFLLLKSRLNENAHMRLSKSTSPQVYVTPSFFAMVCVSLCLVWPSAVGCSTRCRPGMVSSGGSLSRLVSLFSLCCELHGYSLANFLPLWKW